MFNARVETGEMGSKVQHRFRRTDGEPIWFAGIYDRCTTPDAGEVASFGDYHDRAPVTLDTSEWGTG